MPAGMAEGMGNSGRGGTLGRNTNRVNLSSEPPLSKGATQSEKREPSFSIFCPTFFCQLYISNG